MVALRFVVSSMLLISACDRGTYRVGDDSANANSESHSVVAKSPVDSVVSPDTSPVPDLSCSPSVLRSADTLTVHMKTPHPDYLSAEAPDGTTFYIVYPSLGDTSRKYSLVPSEDFTSMSTLRIPASVKANPRVVGRDSGVEPLFTRTGKYVFKLGELEGRYYDCEIQYSGAPRT
jgi:hypothetical protein